jgi:HlyD family secretion protein
MKSKIMGSVMLAVVLGVPLGVKWLSAQAVEVVDTERVVLREIRPTVLASGVLVFQQEIQLSTELIGPVTTILVKEGSHVRKGDALLRLDQRLYEAELEQQRSAQRSAVIAIERSRLQLTSQRIAAQRTEQLVAQNFISASKSDEAMSQLRLAEVELSASGETLRQAAAQVGLSREKLSKTVVRAPIDGTITSLNIKVGETAVPNATGIQTSSLLTIAEDASMLVEVNVDEADVASVGVGQHAAVFPSAAPATALDGEIQSIALSPKVGPQGRSYVVKVKLFGRHPELRTGMTARVEITGGKGVSRPAVALRALLAEPKRGSGKEAPDSYVLKVVNGAVSKVKVDLGLADNSHQEVLAGLQDGELVVVGPARALRELRDGQNVQSGTTIPASSRAAAKTPGSERS